MKKEEMNPAYYVISKARPTDEFLEGMKARYEELKAAVGMTKAENAKYGASINMALNCLNSAQALLPAPKEPK